MTPERLIGVADDGGGRLPWNLPEDLRRFRNLTMGHTVVMGRKTFASIGRALPGRRNLVVSRNINPPTIEGVEWLTSLDEAIESARAAGETECFIAGGTEIYATALEKADRMYVTFVRRDLSFQERGGEGRDTYFPTWDQTQWRTVSSEKLAADLECVVYERTRDGMI